ncbi:hypothetical protein Dimus_038093 [Dionaea muscipula]
MVAQYAEDNLVDVSTTRYNVSATESNPCLSSPADPSHGVSDQTEHRLESPEYRQTVESLDQCTATRPNGSKSEEHVHATNHVHEGNTREDETGSSHYMAPTLSGQVSDNRTPLYTEGLYGWKPE